MDSAQRLMRAAFQSAQVFASEDFLESELEDASDSSAAIDDQISRATSQSAARLSAVLARSSTTYETATKAIAAATALLDEGVDLQVNHFLSWRALRPTWGAVALAGVSRPMGSTAATTADEVTFHRRMQDVTRRLVALEAAYFEDYGDELRAESRSGLMEFLQLNPRYAIPRIGAESRGVVVATWKRDEDYLSLRFVGRDRFDFAFSFRAEGGRIIHSWGKSTLSTFRSEHPEWKRVLTA